MKLDRRNFVKHVSIGLFTMSFLGKVDPKLAAAIALPDDIQKAKDIDNLRGLEKTHTPKLKIPMVAEDGRFVPIELTLDHPMEKDHFVESVDVIVLSDPITTKGRFLFSPQNGRPHLKFQTRMAAGTTTIYAVIACSKHGRWVGDAMIRIVGGGC